jgi:hypothetical protein
VDFKGAPEAPESCEPRILPVNWPFLRLFRWLCVGQMDRDCLHA